MVLDEKIQQQKYKKKIEFRKRDKQSESSLRLLWWCSYISRFSCFILEKKRRQQPTTLSVGSESFLRKLRLQGSA